MDTKYKSHSFVKLWIATTMFMLCCFATGTLAQDAVVADTITTVVETTTEITAAPAETDAETPDTIGELALGLNTVWMLLAAMLVFFMQPGFALVEAGFTRVKNTANILMKNFVDFMFGSLLYWFIGFGLMFGAGGIHRNAPLLRPFFHGQRSSQRRFSGFPDRILCNGSHNRIRSNGRTYQILHVFGLHDFHQCTDISDIRPLDLGWRLADER